MFINCCNQCKKLCQNKGKFKKKTMGIDEDLSVRI